MHINQQRTLGLFLQAPITIAFYASTTVDNPWIFFADNGQFYVAFEVKCMNCTKGQIANFDLNSQKWNSARFFALILVLFGKFRRFLRPIFEDFTAKGSFLEPFQSL